MADISATLIPLDHKLYKHYKAFSAAYLIGKNKFCFPKNGPEVIKKFQNFKVRDDDIYVLTFPKTGTTWLEEIAYVLLNDLDFEKINKTIRDFDIPYVDLDVWEIAVNLMDFTINLASPRCIKLHTSLSLLPNDFATKPKGSSGTMGGPEWICWVEHLDLHEFVENKKIILHYLHIFNTDLMRFPNFRFCTCAGTRAMAFCTFEGSIDDFAELFMENKIPYTPYVTHVKEVWEKRHEKNIYFTTYEELQKNQEKVIAEIAQFMNKSLTDDQIKMVADHCKFDNMKKNPATNKKELDDTKTVVKDFKFMRKGIVGNWKSEMSPELSAKIDKWLLENTKDCPDLRKFL
uniref:Sulfotransferase domain-containing protein n=1 Tax=Strigamia maritima TaxID=126957 RepID=T1II82_STRMM